MWYCFFEAYTVIPSHALITFEALGVVDDDSFLGMALLPW